VDSVSIRVPASPEYVGVVRLVAAGLAARLAFTVDDIDDLKIAVDELSAYVTGPQGRAGILEVRFDVHPDRIEITGTGRLSPDDAVPEELTLFSRQILETVADSAALRRLDGAPTFHVTKSTQR
jgi:serine/threonine-protein kinase RsbW